MGFEITWVRNGERAAFHPDGDLIAIVGTEIDGVELVDHTGRMFERFAWGRSYRDVIWSPGGGWIALLDDEGVTALKLDPEHITRIPLPKSYDTTTIAFGPEEKTLFIKPSRKQLQEYRLPGVTLAAKYLDLEQFRGGDLIGIQGQRAVFQEGLLNLDTGEVQPFNEGTTALACGEHNQVLLRTDRGMLLHDPALPFPETGGEDYNWFAGIALSYDSRFAVSTTHESLVAHRVAGHLEPLAESRMFGSPGALVAHPKAREYLVNVGNQIARVTCDFSTPFSPILSRPGDKTALIAGKLSLKSVRDLATDVNTATFSPDGEKIAVLHDGNTLTIFDTSGNRLHRWSLGEECEGAALEWTGDQLSMNLGYWNGGARLVDPKTGRLQTLEGIGKALYGHKGRLFALKSQGALRTLDPATLQTTERLGDLELFEPSDIAVHPTLPWAIGFEPSSEEGAPCIEVHDLERKTRYLLRHRSPQRVLWLPDVPVLALVHAGWVDLYDLPSQQFTARISLPFERAEEGYLEHATLDASGRALYLQIQNYSHAPRTFLTCVRWSDTSATATEPVGARGHLALMASPTQSERLLLVTSKQQLRLVDAKVAQSKPKR